MSASIIHDRRAFLIALLRTHTSAPTITHKQARILYGLLLFGCNVVRNGKFFTNAIAYLLRVPRGRVSIGPRAHYDLSWWFTLLDSPWDRTSFLREPLWVLADTIELFTDASGWGEGAYFQGRWFPRPWSDRVRSAATRTTRLDMIMLELHAVVSAAANFGHLWSRSLCFSLSRSRRTEKERRGAEIQRNRERERIMLITV
jgi:hypothetical protein